MNNLKAAPRLSDWIKTQLAASAQYSPYKGGQCNLCGKYCKTNRTNAETGVRYHRCDTCGVSFKTASQTERVGLSPTSIDDCAEIVFKEESSTAKPKATPKPKPKPKRKR